MEALERFGASLPFLIHHRSSSRLTCARRSLIVDGVVLKKVEESLESTLVRATDRAIARRLTEMTDADGDVANPYAASTRDTTWSASRQCQIGMDNPARTKWVVSPVPVPVVPDSSR